MSPRLLAIRPEPGLAATLERGRALGLAITGLPLSEIRAVDWALPEPAGIDGLLVGSANAFLHGGDNLAALTEKPVFAVGEATAAAARAAGFAVAATGTGGLQSVLDTVPPPARLLRIAGEEHVPLAMPGGIRIVTIIAYRSIPLPLDPAAAMLREGRTLALFHSAAAARHFAAECDRLGLDRSTIAIAALGARIAAAAGEGWAALHVAPEAEDGALLEMVRDVCQKA